VPPPVSARTEPESVKASSTPAASSHEAHFAWPLNGRILAGFGTVPDGGHNDGISIAAPRGTPISAVDAGTVAYSGNELRGYGNLILIKHADGSRLKLGGDRTEYAGDARADGTQCRDNHYRD
jgi:murein DD-endopeptidase MepM/ murein hydrolase activator NlpD